MARTKIVLTEPSFNASKAVTANAVDLTNDHYIDLADVVAEKIALVFTGGTADMTATIKAGDFSDATLGDLEFTVEDDGIMTVVLESARFKDSDGYILIDLASEGAADGTIAAVVLP